MNIFYYSLYFIYFIMTDSETFIVGDKRQRSENIKHNNKQREQKKNDHVMQNSEFDLLKNLVGPSYIAFGVYGLFNGIFKGTKEITFRNRPKKLIATSLINIIGRQVSRYANAGGCLCLLYSIVRKSTNYLFDEELENCTAIQKQFIYGFLSGSLFKCSRGLYPALFAGVLMGMGCSSFVVFYDRQLINFKLH